MIFIKNIFKTILILGLLITQEAKSFCYPPYDDPAHPTVKQEYQSSNFVITGIVLSEQKISSIDDPIGYIATLYTIRPLQMFKGNQQNKFIIYSSNTTARFPMDAGEKYIVFLKKDSNGLFVDNCGNSGTIENSSSVISKVIALSHQNNLHRQPSKRHLISPRPAR